MISLSCCTEKGLLRNIFLGKYQKALLLFEMLLSCGQERAVLPSPCPGMPMLGWAVPESHVSGYLLGEVSGSNTVLRFSGSCGPGGR